MDMAMNEGELKIVLDNPVCRIIRFALRHCFNSKIWIKFAVFCINMLLDSYRVETGK